MAKQKINRINVYAPINDLKSIIEFLQYRGVVDIEDFDVNDDVFYKQDTTAICTSYNHYAKTSRNAVAILDKHIPKKKQLLSSFVGRRQISLSQYNAFVKNENEILQAAFDIISAQKSISQYEAEIIACKTKLESISSWLTLDIPMSFAGTSTTSVFIGELPGAWTEAKICTAVDDHLQNVCDIGLEIVSSCEHKTCIFVVAVTDNKDEVYSALRKIGFSYPAYICDDTPANCAEELKRRINYFSDKISSCTSIIKQKAKYRDALLMLEDHYSMKFSRYSALNNLSSSAHTFVLSGYVADSDSYKLKSVLESKHNAFVELSYCADSDTPVKLKNNPFSSPVEGIVTTFSTPNIKEADPTAVMSVFYYVFFGLMFSDAGYGALMSIACFWLIKKFTGMEDSLKRTLKMFFWCGLSTFVWGLMFGSFFGNAIEVISTTFFHTSPPNIPGLTVPLWFNPVSDAMSLLMFSFLLGIIHLFSGLMMLAYNHIKNGRYIDVVYDVVSWFLLVGGGILALLSLDMMKNITGFLLPHIWKTVGGLMALVGAVIILLYSGRQSTNPIKRLLKGLYGLYGATGYLSDILSYSRLLALGLATGVIAQVFNQIGAMLGDSVAGVLLFTVVFVVGHTLNIGINALGAYVHTNRLQFVEFFGKFYTGGGREFKPFMINTKNFTVKEVN